MRVVFAGTPDFAVPTLEALIGSAHEVVACYTQPDRPAGRGRKAQPGPVKRVAVESGVPVCQPSSLRDSAAQNELAAFEADVMVVVAYGLLLPQAVLDMPRLGCLNVHASLLPRWRGAAPIHRALLAGDTETGVCVMQMAAGLDTGDVWSRWHCDIADDTTTAQLHDTLARAGAELLVDTLPVVVAGEQRPTPQDDSLSCYAHKLDKSEAQIDWRRSAVEIARQVRAFNPWPVAQCGSDGGTLRLWNAQAASAEGLADGATHGTSMPGIAMPGTVIAESAAGIVVQTGSGRLVVSELQLPGKRRVCSADFLNGHSLLGQILT